MCALSLSLWAPMVKINLDQVPEFVLMLIGGGVIAVLIMHHMECSRQIAFPMGLGIAVQMQRRLHMYSICAIFALASLFAVQLDETSPRLHEYFAPAVAEPDGGDGASSGEEHGFGDEL